MSGTLLFNHVESTWPARARNGVADVRGWCFEEGVARAPAIRLVAGDTVIGCTERIRRPEIALYHASAARTIDCGFRITSPLPAGIVPARLEALADNGTWRAIRHFSIAVEEPVSPSPSGRDTAALARIPVHPPHALGPSLSPTGPALNVLIVIPGDFDSNHALHIVALTRHLAAAGHRFVVAAEHRFSDATKPPLISLATHDDVSFTACTHTDAMERSPVFADGRGADIVHAWTTRDNVRKVCEPIVAGTGARLIVHLEDNEAQILSSTLGRTIEELRNLTPAQADALLPWNLSHPGVAERFLARASGATVIIDRLADFLPPGMPSLTFWPAADERYFFPRPRPDAFRDALGFDDGHTVLFYHGNAHAANVSEMRALYEAVAVLNETGTPTTLIRTGQNHCPFPGDLAPRVAGSVLELGRLKHHRDLPDFMALADFFVQPGGPDSFNNYRFPSKLPEFFSIGRPVILPRTNLGASVAHGRDAFVLDRADAARIAGAIRTLRADPELAARLARGATEFAASHFNWSRSAAQFEDFYRSVVARGAQKS